MIYPCFPLRRVFLLLLCWISFPTSFCLRSKHLCQLCVQQFLHASLLHLYIALCWQYPWDIYVESWKLVLQLKSSYVLIDAFYLETIALWVNSYAKLFYACLQSTIHEKFFLIWFSFLFIIYLLANYRPLPWITSYITCALHYYVDQNYIGSMSLQKLFVFIVYLLEDE